MIHELAQRVAAYLNQELKLGGSRQAIIAYGLEILLGGLVKLVTFIAIPALLGILSQTWAAMLAATFFRLPAGGAHLTAYYRCLTGYLLTFCLIGVIAKVTARYLPVEYLFLIALGLAAIGAVLWAPAATAAKPVNNELTRKKTKIWAVAVLVLYLYLWYRYNIPQDLLCAASLGLLSQLFTMSPPGYRVMDKLDQCLSRMTFTLKGRREVT